MTRSSRFVSTKTVARSRWRVSALALVAASLALAGVLAVLYPATVRWFNAIGQAQQVRQYSHDVRAIGPENRLRALAEAHAYNKALVSGAALKANTRVPVAASTQPAGFDYYSLLRADPYGLMGRITIPSIHVDLPIYHGTSDAVLALGVGHVQGSSLPVGGPGTHAVLAGHRGLATATLFTNLNRVKIGDTFSLFVFGETLTYRVFRIAIVDPDQTKELDPVAGKDLVTLVTCTPIGINSQRILVTGERVTPTPASDVTTMKTVPVGPGFPWWAIGIFATLVVLGFYVWWAGKPRRRRRH